MQGDHVGVLEQAILQDQKATGAGANTSSEALGAHLDGATQAQAEFSVKTVYIPLAIYRTLSLVQVDSAMSNVCTQSMDATHA